MSGSDVDGFEMNEPPELPGDPIDGLLRGAGPDVDRGLADLLGELRTSFASTPPRVDAELAALMAGGVVPIARPSRMSRMRSSLAAKTAAALAAVVAATGGLAVAGALPAPVQHAVSGAADHVGISLPDDTNEPEAHPGATADVSTTTPGSTTTTVRHPDNHGGDVSAVAHDHSAEGCEHGRAVSHEASGKTDDKPCPHATATSTPTTAEPDDDSDEPPDTEAPEADDGEHNGRTTTTTAAPTTPTSEDHHGDGGHGGGRD